MNMAAKKDFDELIESHVGAFGRYQCCMMLLLSVAAAGVGIHNLIQVFTGARVLHICLGDHPSSFSILQHVELGQLSAANFTNDTKGQLPMDMPCGISEGYAAGAVFFREGCAPDASNHHDDDVCCASSVGNQKCHLDVCYYDWARNSSSECAESRGYCTTEKPLTMVPTTANVECVRETCKNWTFDTSHVKSSIVTEWNLICDKTWLVALAQSVHMLGCLVGSLCGGLSDRFGRRKALLVATLVELVSATGTAFAQSYIAYCVMRFITGVGIAAQYIFAYLIALEMVGFKWRVLVGTCMMCFNAVGMLLLTAAAYCLRDWRTLQLSVSVGCCILLVYVCIIPESARWLVARGKSSDAKRIVRRMARFNKRHLPQDLDAYLQPSTTEESSPKRTPSLFGLLRNGTLLLRTFIFVLIWFSNSLVYYGLTLYSPNLGGNTYVNFALSGVVELPASILCLWTLNRFGRRKPLALSMLLSAGALLCTGPLPNSYVTLRIIFAMVGKLSVTAAFTTIYPFSAESFPTVIRTTAMGMCSTSARVGALVAPFITALDDVNRALPLLILGGMCLVGGALVFVIPETKGRPLVYTIEDMEETDCRARLPCFESPSESGGEMDHVDKGCASQKEMTQL